MNNKYKNNQFNFVIVLLYLFYPLYIQNLKIHNILNYIINPFI